MRWAASPVKNGHAFQLLEFSSMWSVQNRINNGWESRLLSAQMETRDNLPLEIETLYPGSSELKAICSQLTLMSLWKAEIYLSVSHRLRGQIQFGLEIMRAAAEAFCQTITAMRPGLKKNGDGGETVDTRINTCAHKGLAGTIDLIPCSQLQSETLQPKLRVGLCQGFRSSPFLLIYSVRTEFIITAEELSGSTLVASVWHLCSL